MQVTAKTGIPETVSWDDGHELDKVAEAAYIEHELMVRGDGMWRPWTDVDRSVREKWERIVTAGLRALNQHRMALRNPTQGEV